MLRSYKELIVWQKAIILEKIYPEKYSQKASALLEEVQKMLGAIIRKLETKN